MTVTEQAAEWLVTISEIKASPQELRRLFRWLKHHPKHIARAPPVAEVPDLIREARAQIRQVRAATGDCHT